MKLNRSESEKRAKSAVEVTADDGRLSRSKSAKVRTKLKPPSTITPPPASSRLNSVSEDSDYISKETMGTDIIKTDR